MENKGDTGRDADNLRRKIFVVPYLSAGSFGFLALGKLGFAALFLSLFLAYLVVVKFPLGLKKQLINLFATVAVLGLIGLGTRAWLGHGALFITFSIVCLLFIGARVITISSRLGSR